MRSQEILNLIDEYFGQKEVYMWSTYIMPNGNFLNPENHPDFKDPESNYSYDLEYEHDDFLIDDFEEEHGIHSFDLMNFFNKHCVKMNVTYPYLYLPEERITSQQIRAIKNMLLNHSDGFTEWKSAWDYDGLLIIASKGEKLYTEEDLLFVEDIIKDIQDFYRVGFLESRNNKIPEEVIQALSTDLSSGIGLVFLGKEILFDLYPEIMVEQNIEYDDIKEVFASYQPFEEDPFYWEIFVRMKNSSRDVYWGDSLTSRAIKDYIYDVKSMEVFNTLVNADNETLKSIVEIGKERWDYYNLGETLPKDYWHDPKYDEIIKDFKESKADIERFTNWAGEELAQRFFKLKDSKRIKHPESDIYHWMRQDDGLDKLELRIQEIEETPTRRELRKQAREGAELLYEDNTWLVYKINTVEASRQYGKDTMWCISGYEAEDYFSDCDDEYYFYINKKTQEKYALTYYNNFYSIYTEWDMRALFIEGGPKVDGLPDVGKLPSDFAEGLGKIGIDVKDVQSVRNSTIDDSDFWYGQGDITGMIILTMEDGTERYITTKFFTGEMFDETEEYLNWKREGFLESSGKQSLNLGLRFISKEEKALTEIQPLDHTKEYSRARNTFEDGYGLYFFKITPEEYRNLDFKLYEGVMWDASRDLKKIDYAIVVDLDNMDYEVGYGTYIHKELYDIFQKESFWMLEEEEQRKAKQEIVDEYNRINNTQIYLDNTKYVHALIDLPEVKTMSYSNEDIIMLAEYSILDMDYRGNDLRVIYKEQEQNKVTDDLGRPLSKEQQNYFKDSKVRDSKGKLLTVYHGTLADFTVFNNSGESNELGYHFGTKEAAKARNSYRLIESYLNITNPLEAPTDISIWDAFGLLDLMLNYNMITDLTESEYNFLVSLWNSCGGCDPDEDLETCAEMQGLDVYEGLLDYESDWFDTVWVNEYMEEIQNIIISRGYDGIYYINAVEDAGHVSWIAFYPEQIKLVSNKTPTGSKNITESINKKVLKTFDYKGHTFPIYEDTMLYHGTKAHNEESIITHGLQTRFSFTDFQPYIWLDADLDSAKVWGAYRHESNSPTLLIGVYAKDLNMDLLELDPNSFETFDEYIDIGEFDYHILSFIYKGDIPFNHLYLVD